VRSIVKWVVGNGPAVNTLMVAVIIVGAVALTGLKKELFPEFQLDYVTITVPYPGASPAEVEEGICQKIEEAIRAVEGIKTISSTASEGSGLVLVELFASVDDAQRVVNEIRSEVDQIPSFPLRAEDPDIKLLSFRQPAIRVAIYGGGQAPEGLGQAELRDWGLREERQLRDLAERVREDLLNLDSVSLCEMLAVPEYQIDVEIPEDALRRYNLSLQDVGQIIRRENIELPAGEIKAESSEYLVRGKNKRLTGDEIAELPLLTRPDGTVLRVGDIGEVRDGFTDDARESFISFPMPLADPDIIRPGVQADEPRPAIVLMVQMTRTEDLIAIVDEVREYVAGLDLPPGYGAAIFDDQSIMVEQRLQTLATNALQGLALVFLVLALFLELRLAFWVALGIPFSIAGAFLVMAGTGVTLNMVTTLAFLLALGIVVDDAIVVGENIFRHRTLGKSVSQAAIDGATEVANPVLASVTTTIFAFAPMFFVSGILGKVIYVMPIVVISMLGSSLAESILILPNHLSHKKSPILHFLARFGLRLFFLLPAAIAGHLALPLAPLDAVLAELPENSRITEASALLAARIALWVAFVGVALFLTLRSDRIRRWNRGDNRLVRLYHATRSRIDNSLNWVIEHIYEPTVERGLRAPVLVLVAAIAILISTLGLVVGGRVPFIVFPDFDSNFLTATVTFPAGTPEDVTRKATDRIAKAVEELHREIAKEHGKPEIRTIVRSVGYSESPGGPGGRMSTEGSNIGQVFVEMIDGAERPVSSFELTNLWRERVGPVPGAEDLKFGGGESGPGGQPIEFQLVGRDIEELEQLAEAAKAKLAEYDGVFDIADDSTPGKPEIQVRVKPEAEALGIDTNALAETIRSTFYGEEVMRLQRGRHEVKLMVRYPEEERDSLAHLREIRVRVPNVGEIPIGEVAQLSVSRGYSAINRVDQQRSITVTADLDDEVANAKNITEELKAEFLPTLLADHPGVRVRWEGQERETNESMTSLFVGFLVALFAMFVLLTGLFRSYLQPLFVLAIVPFGLVGAVWGHLLMGLPLTIFSFFGLVALAGVLVNDSIVLIDFINARLGEGLPVRAALREAGKQRFRPVLLTSLTTIAALAPLMMEKSLQVKVLIPMAVSLAFGLSVATVWVLLLVPTLYAIYADVLDWLGQPVTDVEDEDVSRRRSAADAEAESGEALGIGADAKPVPQAEGASEPPVPIHVGPDRGR